jgi:hypothetical protein
VTARAVRWLAARAVDLAHRREEYLRAGGVGTPWPIYDTINGLAGIGRVLLAALTAGYDTAESGLLAAPRTLTAMIETQHGRRPGWWLPASEHSSAVTVHPSGAATTGMAHDIAGPVSLLATAHTAGWSVAGPSAGRRDAWCYGAPGIGRALILAGSALADPRLSTAGDAAIASLSERPADLRDVEGPTLCHGYAGILQSTTDSHGDTGDSAAAAVTDAVNPRFSFAFRHLHHGLLLDEPGLLTGAAGVALALADHGQLSVPPVPARWDSMLLLS